jgi:hypothetical protein
MLMNDRIGEYPVPPPREAYLPEETDTTQSHPLRTMAEVLQPTVVPQPKDTSYQLEHYRKRDLAESASTPAEINLGPMPTTGDGAIVAWLAGAIDSNDVHAQVVLDAAEKQATEAGITPEEFTEIARQAIAKFAYDRGRF